MYDDDRDTLAAEYVLGTLSADERDQAEALLAIDAGFAQIVRGWERRLGELNVMVEAVEPPPDLWDKIRAEIEVPDWRRPIEPALSPTAASDDDAGTPTPEMTLEDELGQITKSLSEPVQNLDAPTPPPSQDLDLTTSPDEFDDDSTVVSALASSLLGPEPGARPRQLSLPPPPPPPPPRAAGTTDVFALARRARRWRRIAAAVSALAAVLAIFIAVSQLAPGLVPLGRQPQPVVRPPAPGSRLVAVLQQEPTAPAFLLTVDPLSRTLVVRRVSATPEADRSYELWLISNKLPGPRSLGIVGGSEFTARTIPSSIDLDAVRAASYAISLEPSGGSPSGAPTGPILFTGKIVEAVPGSPPPS